MFKRVGFGALAVALVVAVALVASNLARPAPVIDVDLVVAMAERQGYMSPEAAEALRVQLEAAQDDLDAIRRQRPDLDEDVNRVIRAVNVGDQDAVEEALAHVNVALADREKRDNPSAGRLNTVKSVLLSGYQERTRPSPGPAVVDHYIPGEQTKLTYTGLSWISPAPTVDGHTAPEKQNNVTYSGLSWTSPGSVVVDRPMPEEQTSLTYSGFSWISPTPAVDDHSVPEEQNSAADSGLSWISPTTAVVDHSVSEDGAGTTETVPANTQGTGLGWIETLNDD